MSMNMNIDIGMLKNMLTVMGVSLPSGMEPTNPVAEFIDREVSLLMPDDAAVVDLFKGVYVGVANQDPNKVLGVLVRVHEDIGELVRDLQYQAQAEKIVEIIEDNIPDQEEEEIEGPEGEPELDDTIDESEDEEVEVEEDELPVG